MATDRWRTVVGLSRGSNVIKVNASPKKQRWRKCRRPRGAQQVIDAAVQMFGGMGVMSEVPVERLYREIRALQFTRVQLKSSN